MVSRPEHHSRTERVLVGGARQVVVVALLPLWPFVAYPLSLAVWGRRPLHPRARTFAAHPGQHSVPSRMLHSVVRHPVVVALGAPMRFVASRPPFQSRNAGRRGADGRGWGEGPPPAGDREPRRPRSGPPTDAIALAEPHG
ncbi:hypothetical protein [Streptacidiphilus cavernicola]|uniref:Uncharacterized protein n=1 Tax=Streptacidiphilus cavernicola TaxID=3342716 RepID=A0ABV6W4Q7_9ACTN